MKRLLTILLAAGLVSACCLVSCPGSSPGPCPEARAVDFRARGRFLYGFGVGDGSFLAASREGAGAEKKRADAGDRFTAAQRTRLQINAAVSENLSGTVYFEIGTSPWGRAGLGGALGADETNVKVKNAYTDWAVPDTGIRVRMGIQPFVLPNAAGGSAVLDDDAAGITVSWQAAEHAGLTLSWVRPYNDSHTAGSGGDADSALDSLDLFSLALPVSVEGLRVTPWVMWGLMGRNALRSGAGSKRPYPLTFQDTLRWNHPLRAGADGTLSRDGSFDRGGPWTDALWLGLPVRASLPEPWSIELDLNWGRVGSQGRGDIVRADGAVSRYDTKREGWLVKALAECSFSWGVPGIFGWYGSGDDASPGNGSERMPSPNPFCTLTSFMGGGNWGWASSLAVYDRDLSYAGTWGIGAQIRGISFLPSLTHTVRAAWRTGTNSPGMMRYALTPWSWGSATEGGAADYELYLTTLDSLLEVNLVSEYRVHENFDINLEMSWVANFINTDAWERSAKGLAGASAERKDAWSVQMALCYTF